MAEGFKWFLFALVFIRPMPVARADSPRRKEKAGREPGFSIFWLFCRKIPPFRAAAWGGAQPVQAHAPGRARRCHNVAALVVTMRVILICGKYRQKQIQQKFQHFSDLLSC